MKLVRSATNSEEAIKLLEGKGYVSLLDVMEGKNGNLEIIPGALERKKITASNYNIYI